MVVETSELEAGRGLLDTSVVIDLHRLPVASLPARPAICTITLAELSAGPLVTDDPGRRAARQAQLQRVESVFDPLPFDLRSAREYGRIAGAIVANGRKARGARSVDLLIAAVALAHDLPLYTRNPRDFAGLECLIELHGL